MGTTTVLAGCVLGVGAGSAAAQASCPSGWQASSDGTTCTYSVSTAGAYTVAVPSGVTQLSARVRGAGGGDGTGAGCRNPGIGGVGGIVLGTLTVTDGEQLNVVVGGVGGQPTSTTGGAGGTPGGGGAGGAGDSCGGGGGGGSFLFAPSGLLLAAGGGGGASSDASDGGTAEGGPPVDQWTAGLVSFQAEYSATGDDYYCDTYPSVTCPGPQSGDPCSTYSGQDTGFNTVSVQFYGTGGSDGSAGTEGQDAYDGLSLQGGDGTGPAAGAGAPGEGGIGADAGVDSNDNGYGAGGGGGGGYYGGGGGVNACGGGAGGDYISPTLLSSGYPSEPEPIPGLPGSVSLSYTSGAGTISGTIVTPFGDGLGGTTVVLSGTSTATTTTAADGSYSFTNLPGGTYTVTPVVPSGWGADEFTPTECDNGTTGTSGCAGMNLSSGQADVAKFTAGYTLTGNVTGLDGTGMQGATVQIEDTEQGVTQTATATTDASGNFTQPLAPGSVVASVDPIMSQGVATTFPALASSDCTPSATGDACQVDVNHDRSIAFCALAARSAPAGDAGDAADVMHPRAPGGAPSSACPLNVDAQPFDGSGNSYTNYQSTLGQKNMYPAAGIFYDGSTVPRFLTGVSDPGQSDIIDGTPADFQPACLSGCSDIAVHVTQGTGDPTGPAEQNATVTASIFGTQVSLPVAFEPPAAGSGYICALPNGGCGTSGVTATTNQDGNALFRYFLPGVVNPDTGTGSGAALAYPQVTLRFTATGPLFSCGCGEAFGSTGTTGDPDLAVDPWSRLWLNKDATVTSAEARGLKALLAKNAAKKGQDEADAKDILKLLSKNLKVGDKTINALKGLSDVALSEYVDKLARRTPKLVELDWFMSNFAIASDGLLNYNLDLADWGQELKQPLIELLSGKFNKILGAATGPISKKLANYKKLKDKLDALEGQLNKLFKDEVSVAIDKAFGQSFINQVSTIVERILEVSSKRRRTNGHGSLKLYDISTCTGQCTTGLPLLQSEQLFMLFSYNNAGLTFSYPRYNGNIPYGEETPIGFNADYWLKAQCNAPYKCGATLQ